MILHVFFPPEFNDMTIDSKKNLITFPPSFCPLARFEELLGRRKIERRNPESKKEKERKKKEQ